MSRDYIYDYLSDPGISALDKGDAIDQLIAWKRTYERVEKREEKRRREEKEAEKEGNNNEVIQKKLPAEGSLSGTDQSDAVKTAVFPTERNRINLEQPQGIPQADSQKEEKENIQNAGSKTSKGGDKQSIRSFIKEKWAGQDI